MSKIDKEIEQVLNKDNVQSLETNKIVNQDVDNDNKKIEENEKVINTTESVKNVKADTQLQAENFKKAKGISQGPRKKFKCSSVYATLYPDGLLTTYQGLIINLVFDNRIVELPEVVIDFIQEKIQHKADTEAKKLNQYNSKKQENLGSYSASE